LEPQQVEFLSEVDVDQHSGLQILPSQLQFPQAEFQLEEEVILPDLQSQREVFCHEEVVEFITPRFTGDLGSVEDKTENQICAGEAEPQSLGTVSELQPQLKELFCYDGLNGWQNNNANSDSNPQTILSYPGVNFTQLFSASGLV